MHGTISRKKNREFRVVCHVTPDHCVAPTSSGVLNQNLISTMCSVRRNEGILVKGDAVGIVSTILAAVEKQENRGFVMCHQIKA